MALLGVEDVSIAFGGLAALSGVSFEATEGEILALLFASFHERQQRFCDSTQRAE